MTTLTLTLTRLRMDFMSKNEGGLDRVPLIGCIEHQENLEVKDWLEFKNV